MVEVGEVMVNPQSGERFVWLATRASTDGAYCEFELHLSPGAQVAMPHRHPIQEERFTTVTGSLKVNRGGETIIVGPGDVTVIPAGTPHSWGNAIPAESFTIVRLTPALHSEEFFAIFCRLATEGKASASGLPRNPLQLGAVLDAYTEEFAFATPVQHAVLRPLVYVLGALGRLSRFESGREADSLV